MIRDNRIPRLKAISLIVILRWGYSSGLLDDCPEAGSKEKKLGYRGVVEFQPCVGEQGQTIARFLQPLKPFWISSSSLTPEFKVNSCLLNPQMSNSQVSFVYACGVEVMCSKHHTQQ